MRKNLMLERNIKFENIINFTELGVADIHSDCVGSDKKGFTLQLLLYTAPVASIK